MRLSALAPAVAEGAVLLVLELKAMLELVDKLNVLELDEDDR